ncbi:GntR family transcriptional regulator [Nonomuraea roseoviolacea]|uniref:DNA-binding GntR family transcriptional regulator n=1 Tax=Nonomuraea roseoviolacea subsp. carminata TaxID=160689 RepID=A0ABT1KCC3_9ACTN|nr:GntR family transcriptional regulator [Nonomuraea roseoviolacea]MCP2351663.1 DNA-binding GntR family transcriptional regulator [Nonomuraea roseoviolacea subsp. carminata]
MSEPLNLPDLGVRENIRQKVANALRAALIAGEMRPGVIYSAPALAEQFNVSATPVREAMLDLVKEGLVIAVRNKGFRVTELSERDLDEIIEIRELIEVPTIAKIAATVPADRILRLRPWAEAIVAAAEEGDLVRYVEADEAFHLNLLALAGNAHLLGTVRELRHRSRLYGISRLAEGGKLADSAREHLDLLDVVASGDAEAAASLMRRHLRHVRGIWADRPES